MKKIFLFILALMLTTQIARAQSFDATVNRTTVPEGETFVLTLELKDVDTSATPDLNALNKDFTVLSISNGYRTNIINGNVGALGTFVTTTQTHKLYLGFKIVFF